jgi:hypothetical protein
MMPNTVKYGKFSTFIKYYSIYFISGLSSLLAGASVVHWYYNPNVSIPKLIKNPNKN